MTANTRAGKIRLNQTLRIRPAGLLTLALTLALGLANVPLKAQIKTGAPAWQIVAGGPKSFEAASIRPAEPSARFRTNIALSIEDEAIPPGALFSATAQLADFINFAYKLMLVGPQRDAVYGHAPGWVTSQFFTIEARAEGNPTKDQLRLMMQSLLAERFNLAVHFEIHDAPVMALVLVKPGKLGPRLRPHDQGPPCDATIPPLDRSSPKIPDTWNPSCGSIQNVDWANNTVILGSRNTTMEMFANYIAALVQPGRPVVDQTGLTGKFDYELNFTPPWKMPKDPNANIEIGPTILEALKDQLGLKLEPTRAPVRTLVIDHVDPPSPN